MCNPGRVRHPPTSICRRSTEPVSIVLHRFSDSSSSFNMISGRVGGGSWISV